MRKACVVITFTNGLRNEEVKNFIHKSLDDVEIIKVEGNQAALSWNLGEQDDLHDIDEDLYYVLESETLGNHISFIV